MGTPCLCTEDNMIINVEKCARVDFEQVRELKKRYNYPVYDKSSIILYNNEQQQQQITFYLKCVSSLGRVKLHVYVRISF